MTKTLDLIGAALGIPTGAESDPVRCELRIDAIVSNPYQTRRDISPDRADFIELVANIRQQGLLQPIVVTPSKDDRDRYVLIAGERRWRAFQVLSQESEKYFRIPATVIPFADEKRDQGLMSKGLSENLVRTNLDIAELATAIARMREDAGMTYEGIAQALGMAVTRVHDLAAVAKHAPVLVAVRNGQITQAQAITIGHGAKAEEEAVELIAKTRGKDLKQTVRIVKAAKSPEAKLAEPREKTPPDEINVDGLPLAKLMGRGKISREEVYVALERTCDAIGYWPENPNK